MLELQQPRRPPPVEKRYLESARLRYLLAIPPRWDGESVLVSVHGISRNWHEHAREFLPHCKPRGVALLVPRLSRKGYRGYQRLEAAGAGLTADDALLQLLAEVEALTGHRRLTFGVFGFSGGAQFAHRFALAHPGTIDRLAIASAGFYSFPCRETRYPYGLDTADGGPPLDLAGLDLPMRVYVGSRDTERDADLRTGRELDRTQGADRVERARRFVVAVRAAMARMGRSPSCGIELLADCGHSFEECVRTGGLARKVTEFLFPELPDRRRRGAPPEPAAELPSPRTSR